MIGRRSALLVLTGLTGLALPAVAAALPRRTPSVVGFSRERLTQVDERLNYYVNRAEISGAVVMIERHGRLPYFKAIGWQDVDLRIPMRRDSIFWLASMTKPVTAVTALIMVEEGRISLDEPVDRWLPELANRRLLVDPLGALDRTIPSPRAITLRDLLMYRIGLGRLGPPDSGSPHAAAQRMIKPFPEVQGRIDLGAGISYDAWLRQIGALPLAYAPGTRWMYNTSSQILGALVARVSGMPFADCVADRVLRPLEMNDSDFCVPESKRARLARIYQTDPTTGRLDLRPQSREPIVVPSTRPAYPAADGGMFATATDYHRFARMLLNHGTLDGVRILSPQTVRMMTTNYMSPEEQRATNLGGRLFEENGFGFGVSVRSVSSRIGPSIGAYGWNGAGGTSWSADPEKDMVSFILFQLVDPSKIDRIWNDIRATIYGSMVE